MKNTYTLAYFIKQYRKEWEYYYSSKVPASVINNFKKGSRLADCGKLTLSPHNESSTYFAYDFLLELSGKILVHNGLEYRTFATPTKQDENGKTQETGKFWLEVL